MVVPFPTGHCMAGFYRLEQHKLKEAKDLHTVMIQACFVLKATDWQVR
jgi:hypothetical protein